MFSLSSRSGDSSASRTYFFRSILASLKHRLLTRTACGPGQQAKPQRPYATRVPKDKRQPTEPGALMQLDTMPLRALHAGETTLAELEDGQQ